MKVLLINGSPREHGCTYTALKELADTLNANQVETEILWLGTKPMQDCIACEKCGELGHCVFPDLVPQTAARMEEFDGLVIGSPVYYGGPSGRLCSFLDRLFYSTDGEKFQGKLGASVVSCRRGGATASFERLNQYFLISNMHVVGSQYWNQVHGFTPDDVRRDAEGRQTMRTLGQNMAFLMKARQAAAEQGINMPQYEPHVFTSFSD